MLVALALGAPACRDRTRPREPGAAAATAAAPAPRSAPLDLRLWTRMDPAAFGCWMEKALGYVDARWSCSRSHEVEADPCGDPARFHEGPSLPPALAPRLHPLLARVDLAWEGGALQAATFVFARDDMPAADMARILGADAQGAPDVASAAPGDCGRPCFVVTVFEPADPDCEEGEGDGDEAP